MSKSSIADGCLAAILFVAVIAVVTTAVIAMDGFVVVNLWSWFVVPTGAPALHFWQAGGLACLASALTYQYQRHDKSDADRSYWFGLVSRPLVLLGAGWFIHLFLFTA